MENQKTKLLLMPLCVLFGIVLLFAFVNYSHSYLSDYFIANSKDLLGQKVDMDKLAQHLEDARFEQKNIHTQTQLLFWSLSCSPCLEKLTHLAQSSERLIVPINVDSEDQLLQAQEVFKKLAAQFVFYQDKKNFLMNMFKVDYLPTYVLLDTNGFVAEIKAGPNAID